MAPSEHESLHRLEPVDAVVLVAAIGQVEAGAAIEAVVAEVTGEAVVAWAAMSSALA
jgi:hypothetical protein